MICESAGVVSGAQTPFTWGGSLQGDGESRTPPASVERGFSLRFSYVCSRCSKTIRLVRKPRGITGVCHPCYAKSGDGARTHGMRNTRTYRIWLSMRNRCENRHNNRFYCYGARGITICKKWRASFECFLKDMGECPPGLTIDRKNNNGNYSKRNCRWATYEQQNANKRVKNGYGISSHTNV